MENVKDLLDKASRFISFDDFVRKFNVETYYLAYCKVVSTLTRSDKKLQFNLAISKSQGKWKKVRNSGVSK